MKTIALLGTALLFAAPFLATTAAAQDTVEVRDDRILIEGTFGYGFQLGTTEYLPDGAPGTYAHPLVNGYSLGATAGLFVTPRLAVIASYEYVSASSRQGELTGVLSRVQGSIDYHTAVVGLRLREPMDFGALRMEFGLGLLFPYQTELELEYGPALAAAGVQGTGTRTSNYALGFGGHALLGYEVPITGPLYVGLNLKLKVFQSNNRGETTELDNMVTDFGASPPTAVTTSITHDDGSAAPTTTSVQEARIQLAVGARF